MRTVVSMLWLCTGCAYITEDEYAHRMSGKAAPDCALVTQFYADTDEDGYGNPDVVFEGCEAPEGTVDNSEDCDDTDPGAFQVPCGLWMRMVTGTGAPRRRCHRACLKPA